MEATSRIASDHIPLEGLVTQSSFMCMTCNAVFILPDEHGIMLLHIIKFFTALIKQTSFRKSIHDFASNQAFFRQICKHPTHIGICIGQCKWLLRFRRLTRLLFHRLVGFTLLISQQARHSFRIAYAIKFLYEGNCSAALLCRMIVPAVAINRNAVVTSETLLASGREKFFSLLPQKFNQVYTAGTLLLLLCKMYVGNP